MKRDRRKLVERAWLLGVLGAFLLSGCSQPSFSLPWQKVPLDASAGFYDTASIVYRLDAGKLAQPLDVARVEGQTIQFEQVASSPLIDQSIGTLTITYPHPNGRPDLAQASFTLDSGQRKSPPSKAWNPLRRKPSGHETAQGLVTSEPEVHEAWVLDIPRGESDHYFKLLAAESFYNTERDTDVGVQLTVTIDGSQVRKPWDQVPQLSALVQRVRRDGRLVAFARPGVQAGLPEQGIASLAAYRNLLAHTNSPTTVAAAANPVLNPFSMAPPAANPGAVAAAPAGGPTR